MNSSRSCGWSWKLHRKSGERNRARLCHGLVWSESPLEVSSRPQYHRLGSLAEVSRNQRYVATAKPLKKPLGAYLRENFHCATSGMGWEPPIMYVHAVMGADQHLYAMDYPYQFVPEEVVVQDNLPLDAGDKRKFFKPAPSGYSRSD